MRVLFILPLLALAACATAKPEPVVRVVEVKVPIAVSCVPDTLRAEPAYPDTDAALKGAPGAADRYQIIAAGRLLRIQRAAEVEPIIKACAKDPSR
jgi:hypothetical protein